MCSCTQLFIHFTYKVSEILLGGFVAAASRTKGLTDGRMGQNTNIPQLFEWFIVSIFTGITKKNVFKY